MIKSMTGYGKGQGTAPGMTLTVEIRAVNHRYADVTVKAPRSLLASEMEIKKRVTERLRRGKIDVFISLDLDGLGSGVPTLNRPLAEAYAALFSRAAADFGLSREIPIDLLIGQKDVVTLQEGSIDEAGLKAALDCALRQALVMLEGMRRAEGEATLEDFRQRLGTVEAALARIEERAPLIPGEWHGRLRERLEKFGPDWEADPARLAQELAIFADRCDISEEVTRFRSHLQQFRGLFDADEPVGRQLDFLVQELNRETNTMGSKSNDAELTRVVVGLKAELEKIREQVQNVE